MIQCTPLVDSPFGCEVNPGPGSLAQRMAALNRHREQLIGAFYAHGGLLVIRGLQEIEAAPAALVEFSALFGTEVENVRETLTSDNFFHEDVDQILVLSNAPPCSHPPPPRLAAEHHADGALVVQFPERPNWHTDQSYRRPPPDISLLFAVRTPSPSQGQTLYADCAAAWRMLDVDDQDYLQTLSGIHAMSWIGRSERAVRAGELPSVLQPHQRPQHQPLVRQHPVTGKPALYLCEPKQMDFIDGPVAGLEAGPDGAGARLLYRLLHHATQPRLVYSHRWQPGDLVVGDNRCQLHCATWYDSDRYQRLMWRTTVYGNPGDEYRGEAKSWLAVDGESPMAGLVYRSRQG